MNIDYNSFDRLNDFDEKFKDIINDQPGVKKAHDRALSDIEQSVFKGRLYCEMTVKEGQVWFTPSFVLIYSHSTCNLINAYSQLYLELVNKVESHKVTIR